MGKTLGNIPQKANPPSLKNPKEKKLSPHEPYSLAA